MKNVIVIWLVAMFTWPALAQSPPAAIASGLDSLFQNHVNQSASFVPGQVVRIEKPGAWVYSNALGLSSINPASSALPEMKFKIASITKLFTAAAIFKLIQNGQVNFNAPIGTYLPLSVIQGFTDYQSITVKSLLSHKSGINEPQSDFQGRLNYWIYMKRNQDIPLDSLIIWSYGSPRGVGNYYYSNSNFYLLAEIIKSVSGISYQQYITNNIILPLGLTNTDFNTIPTGSFMRGYLRGSFYAIGSVVNGGLDPNVVYDFTEASNSWGYGAADIWSNTTDLIKFHKALFTGQIISNNWVDTMKTIVTVTGDMGSYGYGMIQFNSFNNGPVYGFGHTGSAFGYGSMLCYIPALDVYMCSAGNYMKIGQEFFQRDVNSFLKNILTSTNDLNANNSLLVYPNPSSGEVNIQTESMNFYVEIKDINGKIIKRASNNRTIEIHSLPKGIYLIQLNDIESGKINIGKFVKT